MNRWSALWPLLKRDVFILLTLVGFLTAVWGALIFWSHHLAPSWQTAQSNLQAAQAELSQAQADQLDLDTHRRSFDQLKASGLMDGLPRPTWAEDVQRIAEAHHLRSQLTFVLLPPEVLDLPQAQAINARVTRHAMDIQLSGVHDIEALTLMTHIMDKHNRVARLEHCSFDRRATNLDMKCRVNFLHIEPASTNVQNVSAS